MSIQHNSASIISDRAAKLTHLCPNHVLWCYATSEKRNKATSLSCCVLASELLLEQSVEPNLDRKYDHLLGSVFIFYGSTEMRPVITVQSCWSASVCIKIVCRAPSTLLSALTYPNNFAYSCYRHQMYVNVCAYTSLFWSSGSPESRESSNIDSTKVEKHLRKKWPKERCVLALWTNMVLSHVSWPLSEIEDNGSVI